MCITHTSAPVGGENTTFVPGWRLSTSVDQQIKFDPSTVADEFSHVTEQVTKLLQSHDPKLLVEKCEMIMASDAHNIRLFSSNQIEQLKEYKNTPLLLQELSHLWSWSNHSVMRVLVGSCDEAIKLLDEFDCHLDPFAPLCSYPVSEVAPTAATTQTVLDLKFAKDVHIFTLQDLFDTCLPVINKCGVTPYCPQFLATTQDLVLTHWSVPCCVANLIHTSVLQQRNYFYGIRVLEVGIYPYVKIVTNPDVSLAFIIVSMHVYKLIV